MGSRKKAVAAGASFALAPPPRRPLSRSEVERQDGPSRALLWIAASSGLMMLLLFQAMLLILT